MFCLVIGVFAFSLDFSVLSHGFGILELHIAPHLGGKWLSSSVSWLSWYHSAEILLAV